MRRRATAAAGLAVLAAALLGCAPESGEASDPPARSDQVISVFSSPRKPERYVAEVVAAALRRAGHQANAVEAKDPAEAHGERGPAVRLFFDLDRLEVLAQGVFDATKPEDIRRELTKRLSPEDGEMVPVNVSGHDLLVYDSTQLDTRKLQDFLGTVPAAASGGVGTDDGNTLAVTVRNGYGTGFQNLLKEKYPRLEVDTQPQEVIEKGLSKSTDEKTFPAAVVADTVSFDKPYKKVADVGEEIFPQRTLVALADGSLQPGALKVVKDVAARLGSDEIRVAAQEDSRAFAQRASTWAENNASPALKTASASRTASALETARADPCAEGCGLDFGRALLMTALALLAFVAVAVTVWPFFRRTVKRMEGTPDNVTAQHAPPYAAAATGDRQRPPAAWGTTVSEPRHRVRGELPPPQKRSDHEGRPAMDDTGEPLVVGRPPRPTRLLLPRTATSWQAAIAVDGGLLGGTTVRAASVRGRSHGYRGEPRQDAYGVRLSSDERWVIAAVADGLGSAARSEAASTQAVLAVLTEIDAELRAPSGVAVPVDGYGEGPEPAGAREGPLGWDWAVLMGRVAKSVRERTGELSQTGEGRRKSGRPATTLTVAVLPATGPGRGVCAAVGDSPAARLVDGGWHVLVGTPVKEATKENVTSSLPGAPQAVEVKAFQWAAGDLLILSSDGFHDGLADGRDGFAKDIAGRWRLPPEPLAFLRDVDFRASGFNDDRTVVAIWGGAHDGGGAR